MTYESKDARKPIENDSSKKEVHYHYHQGAGRASTQTVSEKKNGSEVTSVHHHYYYEPPRIEKERSSKPKIVGAMLYIVGIISVIFAIFILVTASVFGGIEGMIEGFSGMDSGEVWGKVTYGDGSPAENVTIIIVDEDINTTTDANGEYLLRDIPIGVQLLRVEIEGYKTIEKTIFVNAEKKQDFTKTRNDGVSIPEGSTNPENDHNFGLELGSGVVEEGEEIPFDILTSLLYFCGIISLLMSVIVIAGGYYAMKRKKFYFVALATVCGIFTIGFFISSIMSFIALFILILARKEFS
jgi:hypothetical protein